MGYGFESYKTDGSSLISSTDGVARLIYASDRAESFNGNISVPDFDINLGYFAAKVYPHLNSYFMGRFTSQPKSEASSWSSVSYMKAYQQQNRSPSLSWNNSTKVLSVTSNNSSENNNNRVNYRYRYRIIMVHYK